MTPCSRVTRPRTSRGRTISTSASIASSKPEPSVLGTPTPDPSNVIRLPLQPFTYHPRTHRGVNSTGSIDTVTKGLLEAMVPGLKISRSDASVSAIRKVVNITEEPLPTDSQMAITTAREDNYARLRKESRGHTRGHYSLPSLHMAREGPQSAARWSEDLDRALEDARLAEAQRQLHRRSRSKSVVGDKRKTSEVPSIQGRSLPPLSVPSRLSTVSPERKRGFHEVQVSPDPVPRESFIIPHDGTPPIAVPRPVPTQLSPRRTMRDYHLPRKLGLEVTAPVRPQGRAGPTWVSSGQATPSNTPLHVPRLFVSSKLAGPASNPVLPPARRPLAPLAEAQPNEERVRARDSSTSAQMTFESAVHSTPVASNGKRKGILKPVSSSLSLPKHNGNRGGSV